MAALGDTVSGAVRKLCPGAFMPARLLPPTGAGRVGKPELEEPVSNIFIRFDTRALLGAFVGDERFGAGASRVAPVRLVGVMRRVWNGDLLGDLLGTGGASEEAREYGGGVALESFSEVCVDIAVWKLPATLEMESGEANTPSSRFGRAGDAGELVTGLSAALLLDDDGSGILRATAAASDMVIDFGVLTLELSPTAPEPSRMPSPCPPSPAGVVG